MAASPTPRGAYPLAGNAQPEAYSAKPQRHKRAHNGEVFFQLMVQYLYKGIHKGIINSTA